MLYPDRNSQILGLRKAGLPYKAIAHAFGITQVRARQIAIRQEEREMPWNFGALPVKVRNAIKRWADPRYEDDIPPEVVAEWYGEYNCPSSEVLRVKSWLADHGITSVYR